MLPSYPLLSARIFNTPLLVLPAKLDAIAAGIGERLLTGAKNESPALILASEGEHKRPGYQVTGNVAVIEVSGILAHKSSMDAECNYILGYQTVAKQLNAALSDVAVKGILMVYDTPGGEVAGVFDLAQSIRAASQTKPVWSVVSDMAASAGYLLAAAGQRVFVTNTAFTGSIGVVTRHVDYSKAVADAGVSVTYVYAGAHKIDGNAFAPLPDSVKADMQSTINKLYGLFTERVAVYRALQISDVMATEAAVYLGKEGIAKGLADEISTPDAALAAFQEYLSTKQWGNTMTANTEALKPNSATETPAQAETFKQGQQAERQRIGAILTHANAQGREQMAQTLALKTELTPEQAGEVLAAAPIAATLETTQQEAKPDNQFIEHMNALGNPKVGLNDEQPEGGEINHKAIQSMWDKALGVQH